MSAKGYILTNSHVVANAKDIKVSMSDGRDFEAKLVGADPKSDLAVLKLKQSVAGLRPLPFGDSDRLRLGDVVIAIGNPFGVGQAVTMGIVSAKGRANMGIVDYEDFIQTDAAINPGNSGGALINLRGELVGINTAILSRTGGYQGIGFAIPTAMARPIMDSLITKGKVVRGWMGVSIQTVNKDMRETLHLQVDRGVIITGVVPGGPAAKAGLRNDDVVVRINNRACDHVGHLKNAIAAGGVGKPVQMDIIRNGKRQNLSVVLGEVPRDTEAVIGGNNPGSGGSNVKFGLRVAPLDGGGPRQVRHPARRAQRRRGDRRQPGQHGRDARAAAGRRRAPGQPHGGSLGPRAGRGVPPRRQQDRAAGLPRRRDQLRGLREVVSRAPSPPTGGFGCSPLAFAAFRAFGAFHGSTRGRSDRVLHS